MNRLLKVLNQIKGRRIIVIGDVMLDKYIWGSVNRISPEAPVQIVNVERESYAGGGSANVAMNISALGGKADIIGLVGRDIAKGTLIKLLNEKSVATRGILIHDKKPTIQKIRIIGQNQQLLRVDYENKDYLSEKDEKKVIDHIKKQVAESEAVVVSDYAKGIITKSIMAELTKQCKKLGKPLIIDPKPKHFPLYSGATVITPNTKEAYESLRIDRDSMAIGNVGKRLKEASRSNILITRGSKGMSLFSLDGSIRHIPTAAKEIYDVTGAGDTVVATIALAMASGASLEEAAMLANHAAGIAVGKVGTTTVTADEIVKSFESVRNE